VHWLKKQQASQAGGTRLWISHPVRLENMLFGPGTPIFRLQVGHLHRNLCTASLENLLAISEMYMCV